MCGTSRTSNAPMYEVGYGPLAVGVQGKPQQSHSAKDHTERLAQGQVAGWSAPIDPAPRMDCEALTEGQVWHP